MNKTYLTKAGVKFIKAADTEKTQACEGCLFSSDGSFPCMLAISVSLEVLEEVNRCEHESYQLRGVEDA